MNQYNTLSLKLSNSQVLMNTWLNTNVKTDASSH